MVNKRNKNLVRWEIRKMDNKVKILIFIFITLLTISSLSHLTQNAFAEPNHQDDEDVEATLHSTLVSDSSEVYSSLMPIGSYSFFETPELDVGSFSHDLTKIDVKELQFPEFNTTSSQDYSFIKDVNGTQGNHTIYFNQEIPEYMCSGEFDTILNLNFNYTNYNTTFFYEDFTNGYWGLTSTPDKYFYVPSYITGDAYVKSGDPGGNYGSYDFMDIHSTATFYAYIEYDGTNPDINLFNNLNKTDVPSEKLYLYNWNRNSLGNSINIKLYNTSDFSESSITWNNKPATGGFLLQAWFPLNTYTLFDIGNETEHAKWIHIRAASSRTFIRSRQYSGTTYDPHFRTYRAKNYYGDNLIYMQTDTTETLNLLSPNYGDINLYSDDSITINCSSSSDHQINLDLLNDGDIVETLQIIPEGNTNFDNQIVKIIFNESLIFDQMNFSGVLDYAEIFECYNIHFKRPTRFKDVYIEDFGYEILGTPYNDNITTVFNEGGSDYSEKEEGNYIFSFDSTSFTHRDSSDDVIILNQNLTIIIELLSNFTSDFYYSLNVSYSTNTWKVPTEISLEINSESVIDSSYNSGYVYLSTFPTTLSITADSNVFFELNITCYFTFTFNLEIISKTYLRKTFKLLSDHSIYIDTIALDSDLDIKKIYLNNDDLGSSNPNHLSPPVQMDTDNIFNLEIILAEVLYRNLPYDPSRELYNEDWSGWNLGYDSDDTISSFSNGNLSSQLQAGYYPGTYSFKDEVGFSGLESSFIDTYSTSGTCYATVINEKNGHKSVLDIYNDKTLWKPDLSNNIPSISNGIVEFWIYSNTTSKFYYELNGASTQLQLYFNSGNIYNLNGTDVILLTSNINNQWSHFKIDFDVSTNNFDFYMNGILIESDIDFKGRGSNVIIYSRIIKTNSGTNTHSYFDAVGYSWDSNYKIGDNMYYENYMGTHDFENYDLSTNENYYGEHGFDYTTEEGYYYMGEDDFNEETVGETSPAWIDIDQDYGGCETSIYAELDGHKNVLQFYDNGTAGQVQATHNFDSIESSRIIEYYIATSDITTSYANLMDIRNNNDIVATIVVRYDDLLHIPYGASYTPIKSDFIENNKFIHIKIILDDSTYTLDCYIDGVLEGNDLIYRNNISGSNNIKISTGYINFGFSSYIDAIGSPNDDSTYNDGDNKNPYDIREFKDAEYELSCALNNSISVSSDLEGHKNVLRLNDNNTDTSATVEISFGEDKTNGTIEFWHYISGDSPISRFFTEYQGWGIGLRLYLYYAGTFQYRNLTNGFVDTGITSELNVWQHHRIEFACSTDSFDWYVDATKIVDDGEFNYARDSFRTMSFSTYTITDNMTAHFDALDFSWSDDYISYRNTNQFYEDLIATNFDDDFILTYAPNTYIMVNGTFDAYKKYVEFFDNNSNGLVTSKLTFLEQTTGAIEFWYKTTSTTQVTSIRIFDGETECITFILSNAGKDKYYDGSYHDIQDSISNIWQHFRIEFDCATDTFDFYIDNSLMVDDGNFRNTVIGVDSIVFGSYSTSSNYYSWFDAISYSWEDDIGVNLLKEMPEIDNRHATINKTISSADLELYSYTVIISFTYKFSGYGAYFNTTKMNDIELIDDNAYHIYSTTITTGQHSFFYTFNISNGILLLSDFNFVIENQHSIQKTINPITTIDSVEFKEYLQADRTFEYWYYRNIYTINDLEIEHDPSSTITSSFGSENYKYYFSQYASTDDEFTGTIDYNPNWQISFTFIVNNASYSYIKVDYGADFVIYNTTLVLDLRNSGIFDDIENPNRDNYVLNVDSLSFSSTTQSLYIIGNRTQQTPNPQTDIDLVQLNEEFIYNSQVLSSSSVNVNPNWQISTSITEKNGTYGKLQVDYKADLPLSNVDLKTSVKRNNMFSDVVETKDYQNDTSINLELDGLSFTTDYQSTYVEGFRTLLETSITTDDIYLDYNEEYKWNGVSLSNYTIGLCPCWLVSTIILENNGTYGKVQVDFSADLSLNNIDLKFSILRNAVFGDSIEIKGYQNTTEINFILENVNFTTSLQSEVVEGFRTLLEESITTDEVYLDFNEEYKWNANSLSNYSIEINPNWQINTIIVNNGTYAEVQVDFKADLLLNNIDLKFSLTRDIIFDDSIEIAGYQNTTIIEFMLQNINFTTTYQTTYVEGFRTLLEESITTDEVYLDYNEEYKWDETSLSNYSIEINPNWIILITFENRTGLYTDIKVEYESDIAINDVILQFSRVRNVIFGDLIEIAGYQNTTIIDFSLSNINFTTSEQFIYIEGFRTLLETSITTDELYLDYNEEYKWDETSLSNYSIEIKPNWDVILSVDNNGTYAKIKIQYNADITINNITLQFSRTRSSIFGDIYELAGYQNTTIIEFSLSNVNFTSSYQTTYIECFRSLTQINPNTNMTYLDFEEQYYWSTTSLSNHSIRINPHWNVDYGIISNNGTFAQLNISYYSDLCFSNILIKLNLKYNDLYAENWSDNALQSLYTYILEVPNINFTTFEQILNLTGVSSVPYCNFSSFINEDGFKLSDEEWKIKITDEEWKTIKKSNWEDIEIYIYGYIQLTKYSRVFIVSNIEDGWELDGIHYQGVPYDVSATGYFVCEGWGSGITSAYLRFKTNPIESFKREQTRGQVIYKIKSKFDLKDVDFIFYIEEDERYNKNDMIKQLKKEIDCTDIIEYYSIEDRTYYMIIDMDLDEGTNKIIINYEIENAAKYAWAFLIVGIAMIGFSIVYISYRYKDNRIIDFIGLDKLVKYFFWIKKSERIKMSKKYRLRKKKKKKR